MENRDNKRISRQDIRFNPEIDKLMSEIPDLKHRPMVGLYNMRDISKVVKALPPLTFPINSAGELIEKLGGSGTTLRIEEIDVDPVRIIKYMPSTYFPLTDMTNFVEKMGELINQNRYKVDLPKEMRNIQDQTLGLLQYPIKNREDLVGQLSNSRRGFYYQGKKINVQQVSRHIPDNYFPINNEREFYGRVQELIVSRPLIVPHTR